ncbi:ribonuclease HIII [bacterium]|nr:ribonuclease HIII [bacterium]
MSTEVLGSAKLNADLNFPIIGTDESGKGDYFGPLVSAGVYVDERSAKELTVCGVTDSKKLTDSKNLEIARDVTRICNGHFAIIEVSPEKYNDLYDQFKNEKKNLNTLLAWGHAKAIEEILSKVDCKVAIADQFADERFILSKLQEKGKTLKLIQMPKAEQNIAVAAASILARARFLEKLSKLSNEYKINLPKGASQSVIEAAKKLVDMHGRESLRKVAKLHFKITTKVVSK